MEMFLMVGTISLLGVVVTLGLFAAAMGSRDEHEFRDAASERVPAHAHAGATLALAGPPAFFIAPATARAADVRIPIEALLLQIERHVRLEQAAAESFIQAPTSASLHSRTTSPFLN